MFAVSGLARLLFLGGWHTGVLPFEPAERVGLLGRQPAGRWRCSWPSAGLLVLVMMWMRWSLPRLRIDQVMTTCLKYFLPISCVLLVGRVPLATVRPRRWRRRLVLGTRWRLRHRGRCRAGRDREPVPAAARRCRPGSSPASGPTAPSGGKVRPMTLRGGAVRGGGGGHGRVRPGGGAGPEGGPGRRLAAVHADRRGLLYFLLGAEFLGAAQLIVYVGGTLVLVVFGVMLTRARAALRAADRGRSNGPSAGCWAPALFGLLVNAVVADRAGPAGEAPLPGGALGLGFLGSAVAGDGVPAAVRDRVGASAGGADRGGVFARAKRKR